MCRDDKKGVMPVSMSGLLTQVFTYRGCVDGGGGGGGWCGVWREREWKKVNGSKSGGRKWMEEVNGSWRGGWNVRNRKKWINTTWSGGKWTRWVRVHARVGWVEVKAMGGCR